MEKSYFLKSLKISVVLLFALQMASCIGHQSTEETTTRGKIKIGADEAYRLIVDTEIFTFINAYIHADIEPIYLSEGEVMQLLLSDSIRLAFVSRPLNEKEQAFFKEQQLYPKTTQIATDGVAFILNNSNPDTNLSYAHLKAIFDGKLIDWQEINKVNSNGNINVVFDHNQSGTARYIKETFGIETFSDNCYAVNNNAEVVNYVEANPNSIGVIGVNWISDSRDSVTIDFKSKIRVAAVSSAVDSAKFVKPFQGYLANGEYPFTRPVYIISREPFTGLGTGFASFVAGDKGQRIILKSGLVPHTMPVRLVNVR